MDQATLVENQIDDVPKLLDELKRGNVEVKAAFWLYASEADQWYLYLVSDLVDQVGITEAYKSVFRVMRQMPDLRIDRLQIKLVNPTDPTARAVVAFLATRHAPVPTRVRSSNLGDVDIEHAYIY